MGFYNHHSLKRTMMTTTTRLPLSQANNNNGSRRRNRSRSRRGASSSSSSTIPKSDKDTTTKTRQKKTTITTTTSSYMDDETITEIYHNLRRNNLRSVVQLLDDHYLSTTKIITSKDAPLLPPDLIDILNTATVKSITHQPNTRQLSLNLLYRLFTLNCAKRYTVSQIIQHLCNNDHHNNNSALDANQHQHPPSHTSPLVVYRILQRLISGRGILHPPSSPPPPIIRDNDVYATLRLLSLHPSRLPLARRLLDCHHKLTDGGGGRNPAVGYSILLKAHGDRREEREVDELLTVAKSRGVVPDVVMLNSLLDAYVECGCMEKAHLVFTSMKQQQHKNKNDDDDSAILSSVAPNARTYNILLKGYARQGDFRRALRHTEDMEKLSLWNDVTTNTLVHAAVAVDDYDAASLILASYTSHSRKKHHPNVEAYTNLMDAHAKSGRLDRALEVLETMIERGVMPNEVTYTCLIAAYARRGDVTECFRLLRVMSDDEGGVMGPPTRVTYNALLSGLLSPDDEDVEDDDGEEETDKSSPPPRHRIDYPTRVATALDILTTTMLPNPHLHPDGITTSLLLESLSRLSPSSSTTPPLPTIPTLLRQITQSVPRVSPRRNARVAATLIKSSTSFDVARRVWNERDVDSDVARDVVVMNAYLDACVRMGRVKLALETFGRCVGGGVVMGGKKTTSDGGVVMVRPDVISYTILIRAVGRGLTERGLAVKRMRLLYDEMREVWGIIPDITLIDVILSAMITMTTTNKNNNNNDNASPPLKLTKTDTQFATRALRDAASLIEWPEGALDERKKILRDIVLGRNDELLRRKQWNDMDSRFRMWGGGIKETKEDEEKGLDGFLREKGWNDVDSGFRIL